MTDLIGRSVATQGRGAIRTRSEGRSTREQISSPQIASCTNCGHDATTHRGGRCWVDAYGLPIYRTRSLIACTCDTYTEGDE